MGERKQPRPPRRRGIRTPRDTTAVDVAVRRALAESHRDLLQFLTRRLGSRDAAEEVLSTFYVRSLSRAFNIRHPAALRSWLHQVLETMIADHYRKQMAERRAAVALVALTPVSASQETEPTLCTCFYKLLPTLKPEYAALIQRVDLEGEPRETVAADLGITVNTLTVRLHRSRSALRRRLEQTCLTCPEHGFFDCSCEYAERVRDAIRRKRLTREM